MEPSTHIRRNEGIGPVLIRRSRGQPRLLTYKGIKAFNLSEKVNDLPVTNPLNFQGEPTVTNSVRLAGCRTQGVW